MKPGRGGTHAPSNTVSRTCSCACTASRAGRRARGGAELALLAARATRAARVRWPVRRDEPAVALRAVVPRLLARVDSERHLAALPRTALSHRAGSRARMGRFAGRFQSRRSSRRAPVGGFRRWARRRPRTRRWREALEKARQARRSARVEKFAHDAKHKNSAPRPSEEALHDAERGDGARPREAARSRARGAAEEERARARGRRSSSRRASRRWFYHHWESLSSQWERPQMPEEIAREEARARARGRARQWRRASRAPRPTTVNARAAARSERRAPAARAPPRRRAAAPPPPPPCPHSRAALASTASLPLLFSPISAPRVLFEDTVSLSAQRRGRAASPTSSSSRAAPVIVPHRRRIAVELRAAAAAALREPARAHHEERARAPTASAPARPGWRWRRRSAAAAAAGERPARAQPRASRLGRRHGALDQISLLHALHIDAHVARAALPPARRPRGRRRLLRRRRRASSRPRAAARL